MNLSSGTIQGSGIGPLLFLFVAYTNELADILSDYWVKVKFFADDLKMYAEIITDDEVECFSSALSCIVDWAGSCKSLSQSVVFYI